MSNQMLLSPKDDFREFVKGRKFHTILADPPWQFANRTGKMAPEHKRLARYPTLTLQEITNIPVKDAVQEAAHLYLWVPNALLAEALQVMQSWGFTYKTNIVWYKVRKDGGPDRRGVGFYFRNVTEMLLFGVRGKNARTLQPGRTQENIIMTQKREHSRKPDEQYAVIESCSPGPYLELFARGNRPNWCSWGNQAEHYSPSWPTYSNHSQRNAAPVKQARFAFEKGGAWPELLGSQERRGRNTRSLSKAADVSAKKDSRDEPEQRAMLRRRKRRNKGTTGNA